MHDTVIIEADIRKNDIRPLCTAELRRFFGSPSLIIVGAFFTVFVLYLAGFRLTMDTLHVLPLPLIVLFFVFLLFSAAIWRGSVQSYKRNKMYLTPTHFEFSDENIQITSKYGTSTILWKDISRIREGRPAFIISQAGTEEYVINKRCFQSQTQLDDFFSLLEAYIDANKLMLKHYFLEHSEQNAVTRPMPAVDTQSLVPSHATDKQIQPSPAPDVIEIRVLLSRRETIAYELGRYYRRGFGIIVSLLGFLMIAFFMYNRIKNLSPLITEIIILITGCFLLLAIPLSIWIRVLQNFKNNGDSSREQVFRYDDNYLNTGCGTDMKSYRWNELTGCTKWKNGFMFTVKSEEDFRKRAKIIRKASGKKYYIPGKSFQASEDCAHFEALLMGSR